MSVLVLGRFADRENRGVHFGRGIVDRDAAGLFLFLFLRIVRRQIGRDAFPGLAVIARAEKKLRADVDRPFLVRRKRDRRVPVEAQLFLVVRLGLNVARFVRVAIYPADVAALVFGIKVIGIRRIGEHPETVAVVHVFPLRVGDAAGILRFADPGAVVLQSAVNLVRIGVVHADVIELRDGQVFAFPPFAAAVVGIPHPAVVAGEDGLRIGRVNPDIVHVAMRALETADGGEALAARLRSGSARRRS